MVKCKNCKHLCTVCKHTKSSFKWCSLIDDCPHEDIERNCKHYEPTTNADRIRSMTDEELISFLCYIASCDSCNECIATSYCHTGHTGMIDWVKKECNEKVIKTIVDWGDYNESEDER